MLWLQRDDLILDDTDGATIGMIGIAVVDVF
jgi:hypothetical protein